MKKIIQIPKKIVIALISTFVIAIFIVISSLAYMGPSVALAQAATATSSVVVSLTVDAGIAISANSATAAMSRNLSMTNMSAVASSTWVVTTNNVTGYALTLKASSTPAMKNATSSIEDFATTTKALWNTTNVPAGTAKFGFSAYSATSTDVSGIGAWGTGSDCQSSSHVPSTTLLYSGFMTSTSTTVATRSATTTFAGSTIVVCYAVQQNAFYVPSGAYTATITATAITI